MKDVCDKSKFSGYDRRETSRSVGKACSLYCWRNGRKVELRVIERSRSGARVVLPMELYGESELFLTCIEMGRESHLECRVAWRSDILGGKAIAGLHCLLTTCLLAA